MGQLDKKQLNIFAKALMPVLYEIQARFNNWEGAVLSLLESNPTLTREEMAERTSKTVRTIQRTLTSLKNKGLIERKGSDKNGEWITT